MEELIKLFELGNVNTDGLREARSMLPQMRGQNQPARMKVGKGAWEPWEQQSKKKVNNLALSRR